MVVPDSTLAIPRRITIYCGTHVSRRQKKRDGSMKWRWGEVKKKRTKPRAAENKNKQIPTSLFLASALRVVLPRAISRMISRVLTVLHSPRDATVTHVIPNEVRAGGGDGQNRHVRELPLEDAELAVLRAEVVPPLKKGGWPKPSQQRWCCQREIKEMSYPGGRRDIQYTFLRAHRPNLTTALTI